MKRCQPNVKQTIDDSAFASAVDRTLSRSFKIERCKRHSFPSAYEPKLRSSEVAHSDRDSMQTEWRQNETELSICLLVFRFAFVLSSVVLTC